MKFDLLVKLFNLHDFVYVCWLVGWFACFSILGVRWGLGDGATLV